MTIYQPRVGMRDEELDTPALLINLDIFESNITIMANFMVQGETELRAHAKTHKCPIIAQKQIEAGAIGICCQKLGEAEVMAAHGIADILITNQVVGPIKIARLVEVAGISPGIIVAVDNPDNVCALAEAANAAGLELGVVIEVDVGMERCGVAPGEAAVGLARTIDRTPGVRFRGLMGFEGHCVDLPDVEARRARTAKANALLVESKEAVEAAGIEVEIVSGGGTGTYMFTGRYPGITEVEAGSYIFMDTSYRQALTDFDISLTVLATVVSKLADDRIILDCGSKTLAGDYGTPAIQGFPPQVHCSLSEEHSTWGYEEGLPAVQVGDKMRVLPAHCCATVNLHDEYYVIRGDEIVDIWPIAARGKTR